MFLRVAFQTCTPTGLLFHTFAKYERVILAITGLSVSHVHLQMVAPRWRMLCELSCFSDLHSTW